MEKNEWPTSSRFQRTCRYRPAKHPRSPFSPDFAPSAVLLRWRWSPGEDLWQKWFFFVFVFVTVVISLSLSFCLTFCCTVLHSLNPLTPCPEKAEGLDKRDRGCSWCGRLFLERILHRENRLFLLLPRLCKWSHLWSRPPLHPRWWFVPRSRVHISTKDFNSYSCLDL